MTTDTSDELDHMLTEGETLRWHDTPSFVPFLFRNGGNYAVVVAVLLVGPYVVWSLLPFPEGPPTPNGVLGLLFVALIARGILRYRNAEYAVTDDRLISFSGTVGRDYSSVEWRKVQDLEAEIGVIDELFDVGTIRASVAGGRNSPESESWDGVLFGQVPTPYAAVEQIEDARAISRDDASATPESDFQFPNA